MFPSTTFYAIYPNLHKKCPQRPKPKFNNYLKWFNILQNSMAAYEYTWNFSTLIFLWFIQTEGKLWKKICINRQQRQIIIIIYKYIYIYITGVVSFQKVHLFTLFSPKIWILAPYKLCKFLFILKGYCPSNSFCTFFLSVCHRCT